MQTQIQLLREELARRITLRGADDPQVEHLRWQIASLERQDRWRRDAAGMFGAPPPQAQVRQELGALQPR